MNNKKRILLVNEAHFLSTGFSNMGKALLPHLVKTGKYEIAELATYASPADPRLHDDNITWKVYPGVPDPNNHEATTAYNSTPNGQFGAFAFNEVVLDFKPDIVITWVDSWMCQHILTSPLRSYYKFIYQPTVDGFPQKQEWLDDYKQADILLTYSHFGKEVLEAQSGGQLKISAVAAAPIDVEQFKPLNKQECRQQLGLEPNINIIMFVGRNQSRKMHPELMKAFALFLEKCEDSDNHELAKNTYLYLHTSSPDVGWDLSYEIKAHKLSHKVLFTYFCNNCGATYTSFYKGDVAHCRGCNTANSRPPNGSVGISREALSKVYNCADLYIQYSTCEGLGIPLLESKACGVPSMGIDYSATSDLCHSPGSIPIDPKTMLRESLQQTYQYRATQNNEETAQKIYEFFTAPKEYRDRLGKEAREFTAKQYSIENVGSIWELVIDSLEVPAQTETWLSPPKFIKPNLTVPQGLNNEQFVRWCYDSILQEPNKKNTVNAQKIISILNVGYEVGQDAQGRTVQVPVDRNKVGQMFLNMVQQRNMFEQLRYEKCVLGKTVQSAGLKYLEI